MDSNFELLNAVINFTPKGLEADINVKIQTTDALGHVYNINKEQIDEIINKNIKSLMEDIEILIKTSKPNDLNETLHKIMDDIFK